MEKMSAAPTRITPADYEDLFAGKKPAPRSFVGVCGRVVRGQEPGGFERLTHSDRRLAWVLGPEEMRDLIGKSGTEIVLGIGKDWDWLRAQVKNGMHWRLFVLPESGMVAATWDNLLALIAEHYPEVAPKLLRWDRALRDPRLVEAIDSSFTTSEVKDNEAHPLHMSLERYQKCPDTPENARLFLWHTLGINHRFTGSGRTMNPDGSEGFAEYLMPNRSLADFPGYRAIPLEVSLD